jgi:hypothetical protein
MLSFTIIKHKIVWVFCLYMLHKQLPETARRVLEIKLCILGKAFMADNIGSRRGV